MYHIHRTKGLIIKSIPIREADKQLTVLTKEFGLLKISAQGIRKIESKLRFSIQDFSLSRLAMVKGKNGWRLTNASLINNFYNEIENQELKDSILRVLNLIDRLVVDESDEHKEVFEITFDFIDFARNSQDLFNSDLVKNFEIVFLLNILADLGYVDVENLKNYLGKVSLEKINNVDQQILEMVNQGIRESGL